MLRTLTAVLFLLLLPLHSSSAASLVTDANGILIGARGIEYLGNKYDVDIGDGTCVGLYSGCDSQSDFPFNGFYDGSQAVAALQALVESNVTLNRSHQKLKGCGAATFECSLITPYPLLNGSVGMFLIIIYPDYPVNLGQIQIPIQTDTTTLSNSTYARWSKSTSNVPEPSTLMLLGIGWLSRRWLRIPGK